MIYKYCGNEMVKGYIQCRDGVFSGSAVEAYRCEKCRKIIINY